MSELLDDPSKLTRRSLLERSGMGLGSLALAGLFADQNVNEARGDASVRDTGLGAKPAHFGGRAKRVIHFFLNGGPSHVDTFDPKPALAKYAGQSAPVNLTTERKTGAAFPSVREC